jgi:hypothetical protein
MKRRVHRARHSSVKSHGQRTATTCELNNRLPTKKPAEPVPRGSGKGRQVSYWTQKAGATPPALLAH